METVKGSVSAKNGDDSFDKRTCNVGDRCNGKLVVMTGMCPTGPHMLVRFILMCFRNSSGCLEGPLLTGVSCLTK